MTQTRTEQSMSIKVLYFASLKELLGRGEETLSLDSLQTVDDVWKQVSAELDTPFQLLCSVNQEYATMDSLVQSGDEVAFFPPVTGG